MSRFQKVDLALRGPGECFITKTPNGPFIDTRLDFGLDGRPAFRGRVYIAVEVLHEMAEQAGLFDQYTQMVHQTKVDLSEYEGAAYQQGYDDALKEALRDDTQLVDLLRDLADRLPRNTGAAVAAAVAAVEVSGGPLPSSPDNPFLVALPTGEGTGAGRGKRPAGVSGNPSDGDTAAVQ